MNSYSIRQDGVHTGLWTDHSNGKWLLTLPTWKAAYLLTATTVFIGIVGDRVWSIQQFLIHDYRARRRRTDGLGLQHRTLHRNGASQGSTMWETVKIWWAWRQARPRARNLNRRSLYALCWPLLNFSAFAAFGILASRVANKGYQSGHVLLKPKNCGLLMANFGLNDTKDWQPERFIIQTALNNTQAARQYAHDCYGSETGMSSCSMFPSRSIPYSIETVDCPFGTTPAGNNICQPNGGKALRLSTSNLDTGQLFGINVLDKNQIEIGKSLTCAPIAISEYIRTDSPGLDNATMYLELGPVPGVSPYTMRYRPNSKEDDIGYQIFSLTTGGDNIWSPVDALNVQHGDASVTVVAANAVKYVAQVKDPWFSANQYDNATGFYSADQDLSAVACVDQYQLCNPATDGNPSKCTIMGNVADVARAYTEIGLNKYQTILAKRMSAALWPTPIWAIINFEGVGAMLASRNVIALTSSGLADDQWELEVRDWFETSLAGMQAAVVQYVNNLDQAALGIYASISSLFQPSVDGARGVSKDYLCTSQRVRNTGDYINFSFTALLAIYIVGLTLILTSFVIERLWRLFTPKRGFLERDVVRTADSQWQISRKMIELQTRDHDHQQEVWSRKMKDVPVTGGKTMFVAPEPISSDDGANRKPIDYIPTRPEVMAEMIHSSAGPPPLSIGRVTEEDLDMSTVGDGKIGFLPRIAISEKTEEQSLMADRLVVDENEHDRERIRGIERSDLSRSESSVSALTSDR